MASSLQINKCDDGLVVRDIDAVGGLVLDGVGSGYVSGQACKNVIDLDGGIPRFTPETVEGTAEAGGSVGEGACKHADLLTLGLGVEIPRQDGGKPRFFDISEKVLRGAHAHWN